MNDGENRFFFKKPTQVAFYDKERETYVGGLCYKEELVSLKTGEAVKIEEYLERIGESVPYIQFPIVSLTWADISEDCLGDVVIDATTGEITY